MSVTIIWTVILQIIVIIQIIRIYGLQKDLKGWKAILKEGNELKNKEYKQLAGELAKELVKRAEENRKNITICKDINTVISELTEIRNFTREK